jgi:hypothetical protein
MLLLIKIDQALRTQGYEAYSPKCSMANAGPPRSHENELPPRLFSHQCLEEEFSEVGTVFSLIAHGEEILQ